MKLQFDPNQDYQKQAINAIVESFEGQPLSSSELDFKLTQGSLNLSENGVGNNIVLRDEQIWKKHSGSSEWKKVNILIAVLLKINN